MIDYSGFRFSNPRCLHRRDVPGAGVSLWEQPRRQEDSFFFLFRDKLFNS
jgi:hypothetical protein